jgi:hypothetical protein
LAKLIIYSLSNRPRAYIVRGNLLKKDQDFSKEAGIGNLSDMEIKKSDEISFYAV